MNLIELIIDNQDEGKRLDVYINDKVEELTRSHIQKLIEDGMVQVNGAVPKTSMKVKAKQTIKINIPEPKQLEVPAEDIAIEIIYQDGDLAVVNKPKG